MAAAPDIVTARTSRTLRSRTAGSRSIRPFTRAVHDRPAVQRDDIALGGRRHRADPIGQDRVGGPALARFFRAVLGQRAAEHQPEQSRLVHGKADVGLALRRQCGAASRAGIGGLQAPLSLPLASPGSRNDKSWWKQFTRSPAGSGCWREAYRRSGGMEALYIGMPRPVGLAAFADAKVPAGSFMSSRERLAA